MPKINVYLPDDLAEAVKTAGVPVSAICQRALEQSVKRVTAIRDTLLGDLEVADPTARLTQFTGRAKTTIKLAVEQARAEHATAVGTEHLLHGVLAEGGNLALQVLRALDVDPDRLRRDLDRVTGSRAGQGDSPAERFSGAAANALELSVTEAISLGHNYVGCEHLLLGLLAEPDGTGGDVLRAAGIELRAVRGAIVAALAGYAHLRATAAGEPAATPPAALAMLTTAIQRELRPVLDRIDRLEQRSGLSTSE